MLCATLRCGAGSSGPDHTGLCEPLHGASHRRRGGTGQSLRPLSSKKWARNLVARTPTSDGLQANSVLYWMSSGFEETRAAILHTSGPGACSLEALSAGFLCSLDSNVYQLQFLALWQELVAELSHRTDQVHRRFQVVHKTNNCRLAKRTVDPSLKMFQVAPRVRRAI